MTEQSPGVQLRTLDAEIARLSAQLATQATASASAEVGFDTALQRYEQAQQAQALAERRLQAITDESALKDLLTFRGGSRRERLRAAQAEVNAATAHTRATEASWKTTLATRNTNAVGNLRRQVAALQEQRTTLVREQLIAAGGPDAVRMQTSTPKRRRCNTPATSYSAPARPYTPLRPPYDAHSSNRRIAGRPRVASTSAASTSAA